MPKSRSPNKKRKASKGGGDDEDTDEDVIEGGTGEMAKPLVAWYRQPDMGGRIEIAGTPPQGVYDLANRFQIDTFMMAHNWYPQPKGGYQWRRAQSLLDTEDEEEDDDNKVELLFVYTLETFAEIKRTSLFSSVRQDGSVLRGPLPTRYPDDELNEIQSIWLEEAALLMEYTHHTETRRNGLDSLRQRQDNMALMGRGYRTKKGKGKK